MRRPDQSNAGCFVVGVLLGLAELLIIWWLTT